MSYVDLNTIHNPTTGAVIPTAWGDQIRANQEFLIEPPACSITTIGEQDTVVLTATETTIGNGYLTSGNWAATANFDNDGMWAGGTSNQIDINTAGRYMVICTVQFDANAVGMRQIKFRVNGTTPYESSLILSSGSTNSTVLTGIRWMTLAVSDYIEVRVAQKSGDSVQVSCYEFAVLFQTR